MAFSALATLAALLYLSTIRYVEGYRLGAPSEQCGAMTPTHTPNSPQSGASPFQVMHNIPSPYALGTAYTVNITSTTAQTFKGFFCQTRDAAAGTSSTTASSEGSFTPTTGTKNVMCNSNAQGGLTHSDRLPDVRSISFAWTAPSTPNKNLIVICTVVNQVTTYWIRLGSTQFNAPAAPTTAAGATTPAATTPAATGTTSATPGIPSDILSGCTGSSPTKYCFTLPVGCRSTSACDYMYTHRKDGSDIVIELFGKTVAGQGWVGIGYSTDQRMGSDDVLACDVDSQGIVNAKNLHNVGYTNVLDNGQATRFITQEAGISANGQLYCRFRRPISTGAPATDDYNLNNNYYFLFPRRTTGNAAATARLVGHHSTRPTISAQQGNISSVGINIPAAPTGAAPTTAAPTTAAPTTAAPTTADLTENCMGVSGGASRVDYCIRLPGGCTGQSDCQYIYSERREGGNIVVELFGQSTAGQGYVAIGYSADNKMGNDDILACEVDSAGMVNAKNLHSVGRTVVSDNGTTTNFIQRLNGSQTNGNIYCRISRPLVTRGSATDDMDLTSPSLFLLHARRTTGTAAANQSLSGRHSVAPVATMRVQARSGCGEMQQTLLSLILACIFSLYFLH